MFFTTEAKCFKTFSGKGVVVIGGAMTHYNRRDGAIKDSIQSKVMFELCNTVEWIKLEQTLQYGRIRHLTIYIPDHLTCVKSTKYKI